MFAPNRGGWMTRMQRVTIRSLFLFSACKSSNLCLELFGTELKAANITVAVM